MFEALNNRRGRWRVFWPEVDDLAGADEAIRLCYWFAFANAVIAAVGGAVIFLTGSGDLSGFVGAAMIALVGVGVKRRWRSAAVVGLFFLLLGVVVVVTRRHGPPGVLDVLTLVAFMSGVRGTFAFARLTKLAAANAGEPMNPTAQGAQAS